MLHWRSATLGRCNRDRCHLEFCSCCSSTSHRNWIDVAEWRTLCVWLQRCFMLALFDLYRGTFAWLKMWLMVLISWQRKFIRPLVWPTRRQIFASTRYHSHSKRAITIIRACIRILEHLWLKEVCCRSSSGAEIVCRVIIRSTMICVVLWKQGRCSPLLMLLLRPDDVCICCGLGGSLGCLLFLGLLLRDEVTRGRA